MDKEIRIEDDQPIAPIKCVNQRTKVRKMNGRNYLLEESIVCTPTKRS